MFEARFNYVTLPASRGGGGGASAMADPGFSLLDIKNLGDWSNMSVLHYLTKSPRAKMDLDAQVVCAIYK